MAPGGHDQTAALVRRRFTSRERAVTASARMIFARSGSFTPREAPVDEPPRNCRRTREVIVNSSMSNRGMPASGGFWRIGVVKVSAPASLKPSIHDHWPLTVRYAAPIRRYRRKRSSARATGLRAFARTVDRSDECSSSTGDVWRSWIFVSQPVNTRRRAAYIRNAPGEDRAGCKLSRQSRRCRGRVSSASIDGGHAGGASATSSGRLVHVMSQRTFSFGDQLNSAKSALRLPLRR